MTTDTTALAREVLGRETWLGNFSYSIPLEAQAAWDAMRSEQARAAPALARAVHNLTTELAAYREENIRHREKIARMEALADELDREADRIHVRYMDMGDHAHGLRDAYREDAKRIRATLNGGDA